MEIPKVANSIAGTNFNFEDTPAWYLKWETEADKMALTLLGEGQAHAVKGKGSIRPNRLLSLGDEKNALCAVASAR